MWANSEPGAAHARLAPIEPRHAWPRSEYLGRADLFGQFYPQVNVAFSNPFFSNPSLAAPSF